MFRSIQNLSFNLKLLLSIFCECFPTDKEIPLVLRLWNSSSLTGLKLQTEMQKHFLKTTFTVQFLNQFCLIIF